MRHREAWAVEKRAPSEAAWRREQESEAQTSAPAGPAAPAADRPRPGASEGARTEARRVVAAPTPAPGDDDGSDDVLIVVTKLKKYIRARSGMNTSDGVMPVLSAHLRRICDMAIRKAAEDGRKTVLDRDFKAIL
jgi:hypothetical protein